MDNHLHPLEIAIFPMRLEGDISLNLKIVEIDEGPCKEECQYQVYKE